MDTKLKRGEKRWKLRGYRFAVITEVVVDEKKVMGASLYL